jgi:hypothetical protein
MRDGLGNEGTTAGRLGRSPLLRCWDFPVLPGSTHQRLTTRSFDKRNSLVPGRFRGPVQVRSLGRMTSPISRYALLQVVVDAALIAAAWYLAFLLRFDSGVPVYYLTLFERSIVIVLGVQLMIFIAFGFYRASLREGSTAKAWRVGRGLVVASVASTLAVYFANPVSQVRMPRSIVIVDFLLLVVFVGGAHALARTLMSRQSRGASSRTATHPQE